MNIHSMLFAHLDAFKLSEGGIWIVKLRCCLLCAILHDVYDTKFN